MEHHCTCGLPVDGPGAECEACSSENITAYWKERSRYSTEPEDVATFHWEWVEGLLATLGYHADDELPMEAVEYLYRTGMVHGWKHGIAQAEGERGGGVRWKG